MGTVEEDGRLHGTRPCGHKSPAKEHAPKHRARRERYLAERRRQSSTPTLDHLAVARRRIGLSAVEQIAIEQIGRGVYLARIVEPTRLLQVRMVASLRILFVMPKYRADESPIGHIARIIPELPPI